MNHHRYDSIFSAGHHAKISETFKAKISQSWIPPGFFFFFFLVFFFVGDFTLSGSADWLASILSSDVLSTRGASSSIFVSAISAVSPGKNPVHVMSFSCVYGVAVSYVKNFWEIWVLPKGEFYKTVIFCKQNLSFLIIEKFTYSNSCAAQTKHGTIPAKCEIKTEEYGQLEKRFRIWKKVRCFKYR